MLARFTFSITVPKFGEERWIFSQKNQCGIGKISAWKACIYLFICTYIYLTCDTDEEIIDFKI